MYQRSLWRCRVEVMDSHHWSPFELAAIAGFWVLSWLPGTRAEVSGDIVLSGQILTVIYLLVRITLLLPGWWREWRKK